MFQQRNINICVSQVQHCFINKKNINMQSTLNTELLAGMLKEKRGSLGLRAVAEAIGGVSAATLSRIEQGKLPDVDTFIKICQWMETPTDTFIVNHSDTQAKSNKDYIIAHLRAERELDQPTIKMLLKMIDLAYDSK
jgi:transcriptional regulator with XRE-family HTH domain